MNNLLFTSIAIMMVSFAQSHPGVGIVMDSKGNVFYTDLKQIWRIDNNGRQTIAVDNVHSHELYLDDHDNLYGEHLWYEGEATDRWGHYVWKLSPSGKLEKVIPATEGFLKNYSFVRDHHGHMFWADRRSSCTVIKYKDRDNSITTLTDACLHNVRWMTATAKGNIYLIDTHDLKKIDHSGNVHTLAEDLDERKLTQFHVHDPHLLMGVWTDDNENVYVAVYGARQVKKITPAKKVTVVAETAMFWSPTGGLVAPDGDFWLLEYSTTNAARVERITTDGRRIIYSGKE